MFPLALILVPLNLFTSEAVPKLEELNYIFRCLFEYDKSIDTPCVKAHPVLSIEDKFSEKFKSDKNDLIISVEGVESALDYVREVRWIEPVEEYIESLGVVTATTDAAKDIEQLHDIFTDALSWLHCVSIHWKEMLDLWCQLFEIVWELLEEFLGDP